MNTPIHNAKKYKVVCHICNEEFMGKRESMKYCYKDECQRVKESASQRRRTAKKRAEREAANDGA